MSNFINYKHFTYFILKNLENLHELDENKSILRVVVLYSPTACAFAEGRKKHGKMQENQLHHHFPSFFSIDSQNFSVGSVF